jgi:hypothetical protein
VREMWLYTGPLAGIVVFFLEMEMEMETKTEMGDHSVTTGLFLSCPVLSCPVLQSCPVLPCPTVLLLRLA